jgi:hypothetical protein
MEERWGDVAIEIFCLAIAGGNRIFADIPSRCDFSARFALPADMRQDLL